MNDFKTHVLIMSEFKQFVINRLRYTDTYKTNTNFLLLNSVKTSGFESLTRKKFRFIPSLRAVIFEHIMATEIKLSLECLLVNITLITLRVKGRL
jgi:hypothetical protein